MYNPAPDINAKVKIYKYRNNLLHQMILFYTGSKFQMQKYRVPFCTCIDLWVIMIG